MTEKDLQLDIERIHYKNANLLIASREEKTPPTEIPVNLTVEASMGFVEHGQTAIWTLSIPGLLTKLTLSHSDTEGSRAWATFFKPDGVNEMRTLNQEEASAVVAIFDNVQPKPTT